MGRGSTPTLSGNSAKLVGIARGCSITLEGREYAWEPIFTSGDNHFFCGQHQPEEAVELNSTEVASAIETWLGSDKEALQAEGNYTRFPVRPPHCEECENPLVWENRAVRLA